MSFGALKTIARTFTRHRGYTFINITGLAVGLACAVLILLIVQDELSYDRYHENADRMYRLVTGTESTAYEAIAKVSGPWGPAVQADLPEVEQAVRFRFREQTLVGRGETRFYESGAFYTDPEVFQVFSFPLLQGDPRTALAAPNSVVLTVSVARKYFGDDDPMGQALTFDGGRDVTVTGVMADVPPQSHFTFPFLLPRASEPDSLQYDWVRNQHYTYLLLAPGADPDVVAAKIPAVLARHVGADVADRFTPRLQAVTDIHLHSNLFREMAANADITYVYLFFAVAFFILLIACINFMNLSTARSARRAKEVGVRKAAGAGRGALVRQFLGESLLMSMLALVMALGLVSMLLPSFNVLTGKALGMARLLAPAFVLGLAGLTLFVGLVSGSYPAFVLSSYRPMDVLKGRVQGRGHAGLRKGLVVFQFAISVFLIIAAVVVQGQLRFIQEQNLGFAQAQQVILPIRSETMRQQTETFKQAVRAQAGVVSVSASANMPGGSDYGIPIQPEGVPPEAVPSSRILAVDADFLATYEMEMAAGRGFSGERVTDAGTAFLINETAARAMGWDSHEGKRIAMEGVGIPPSPVLGIVKDFHFRSMHEQIGPLVFFIPPPEWFSYITVRIQPGRIDETLAALGATWAQFEPDHPFTYSFLDEQFAGLYLAERRVGTLLGYATMLAIFIACLGLFGLASFTAEQRTKELGIRKVLGATVGQIVLLLSKDFARLVVVALVVAAPVAYFAMSAWLAGFAYHAGLSVWIFLAAGGTALLVAVLTVSYQAVRAALSDPVKALRYE